MILLPVVPVPTCSYTVLLATCSTTTCIHLMYLAPPGGHALGCRYIRYSTLYLIPYVLYPTCRVRGYFGCITTPTPPYVNVCIMTQYFMQAPHKYPPKTFHVPDHVMGKGLHNIHVYLIVIESSGPQVSGGIPQRRR